MKLTDRFTDEELAEGETVHGKAAEDHTNEKYSLADAFKLLIKNKYYLMICGSYILMQIYTATLNLYGYTAGTLGRLGVVIAGYMGSIPLMLACTAIAAFGMSPLQGDMNALIATCSEYTYLTHGKRVDGTMYSCTSLGTKLGGGIGTALAGWLLSRVFLFCVN